MMSPIYIAASKLFGQQKQLDVIASNVANLNTSGYKRQTLAFEELVSRHAHAPTSQSFTKELGIRNIMTPGDLQTTGNPFDIAIQGEGFFAVDNNGRRQYTRDGHFVLNADRNLTTPQGALLLDNNGAPITIPEGTTDVIISGDGSIAGKDGVIAKLGVFQAQAPKNLVRASGSSFVDTGNAGMLTAETPKVQQGAIEGANINAIEETANMTNLMRAYQDTVRAIGTMEDLEQKVVRSLATMPN